MSIADDMTMKVVYDLRREHANNPEYIAQVQALTKDSARPKMGLRGSHGLYGSEEWWKNIERKRLKLKVVSGVITKLTFAGQDSRCGDEVNTFELEGEDGTHISESIYAHEKADRKLFQVGKRVMVVYVLDELKSSSRLPFGKKEYLDIVVEMSVARNER